MHVWWGRILRLRGRTNLGATLVEVLANYAGKLHESQGRLYLTGIGEEADEQMVRTANLRLTGPVRSYEATAVRGQSTREAHADAETWLVSKSSESSSSEESQRSNPS